MNEGCASDLQKSEPPGEVIYKICLWRNQPHQGCVNWSRGRGSFFPVSGPGEARDGDNLRLLHLNVSFDMNRLRLNPGFGKDLFVYVADRMSAACSESMVGN